MSDEPFGLALGDPGQWRVRVHARSRRVHDLDRLRQGANELDRLGDRLLGLAREAEDQAEVGGDAVLAEERDEIVEMAATKRLLRRLEQLVGRAVDGWTAGFPTEVVADGRPCMVAVTMNGEPLPVKHGFPARLIIPGLYGYVSATKWLTEIELTTWEAFDGYWIPRGWAKEGPIKTQSRIDVPRAGATLTAGPTAIAGVAWAPTRSIERVEVRVDDGRWHSARLSGVLSEHTWVQWTHMWEATPGAHRLQVRATDGDGNTQTADLAPPAPSGATGYHTIRVEVT